MRDDQIHERIEKKLKKFKITFVSLVSLIQLSPDVNVSLI